VLVLPDVGEAAWASFQDGAVPRVNADLLACWSRAKDLGARTVVGDEERLLRGDALRLHASHVELVVALGDAILDRATAQVAARDFLLLLADPEGVVISTHGGGGFEADARRLRLIEGASWSESARGTNAIGTAAATNQPVACHGHAHFGAPYRDLVCYAAPIRGIDGAPIAVLDATAHLGSADEHVGRVITRTALALEELLRLQAYATAGVSITRVLGTTLDRIREPALVIESPGRIARMNAAASALDPSRSSANPQVVLGLAWTDLVTEALAPSPGGRHVEVARRSYRLRVEPITAPGGHVLAVIAVLEPRRVAPAVRALAAPADAFSAIFAEDAAVTAAITWSRRLAPSAVPVMLLAETGAGKELFARALHEASRREGPLVAINCGAVAPSLLESELFGYAAGAFTGADRAGRPGVFQAATGGTLFLDEVAEMSGAMQASLLRVIESGAVRRVGDTRLEKVDVRIICATCRDLPALVAAGHFRQDLYYRLKGATVTIPPLRDRTDIVALAEHLLGHSVELTPAAAAALASYAWPGNVRELKTILSVAQLRIDGDTGLDVAHLPAELTATPSATGELEQVEATALRRALAESNGNLSAAARKLGIARSTLYRMLRKHS